MYTEISVFSEAPYDNDDFYEPKQGVKNSPFE